MVYGCFSPNLEMYDTFSSRQRKQGMRSKTTLKNVKSLKSLIGDPKDFIHHDHFGLLDAQKLMSRPSNSNDPTNSYPSSPALSFMAVGAPLSPTSSVNSPLANRSVYSPSTGELSVYSTYKDPQPSAETSAGESATNRIRRKSVPHYTLHSDLEKSERTEYEAMKPALITVTGCDFGPRGPPDGKQRPFKLAAAPRQRSSTQVTKFTWNQQTSEIANALKEQADEFGSVSGIVLS